MHTLLLWSDRAQTPDILWWRHWREFTQWDRNTLLVSGNNNPETLLHWPWSLRTLSRWWRWLWSCRCEWSLSVHQRAPLWFSGCPAALHSQVPYLQLLAAGCSFHPSLLSPQWVLRVLKVLRGPDCPQSTCRGHLPQALQSWVGHRGSARRWAPDTHVRRRWDRNRGWVLALSAVGSWRQSRSPGWIPHPGYTRKNSLRRWTSGCRWPGRCLPSSGGLLPGAAGGARHQQWRWDGSPGWWRASPGSAAELQLHQLGPRCPSGPGPARSSPSGWCLRCQRSQTGCGHLHHRMGSRRTRLQGEIEEIY